MDLVLAAEIGSVTVALVRVQVSQLKMGVLEIELRKGFVDRRLKVGEATFQ